MTHSGKEDGQAVRDAKADAADAKRETLDSISVVAFDADARIFRSFWHSIIRPVAVCRSALSGDHSQYLSPIRVFVALFGFQLTFIALFGGPAGVSLAMLTPGIEEDAINGWLSTGRPDGLTANQVDQFLTRWSALLAWPIVILSSLPVLVLLKLYRPSMSWWGHTLLYLVPVNGSFVVMIAILPLSIVFPNLSEIVMLAASLVGLLVSIWLFALVIARFYSSSALGIGLRLAGLIILFPIGFVITGIVQLGAAEWMLSQEFGLSLFELYQSIE